MPTLLPGHQADFGKILQVVRFETGALTTGSVAIPFDDTIPQNTEGVEIITLSITPKFSSSLLRITLNSQGQATNGVVVAMALFRDSIVSAISSTYITLGGNFLLWNTFIDHQEAAGSTSLTTFKMRIGPTSGTVHVNGYVGSVRRHGGTANTAITIFEVAV